MQLGDVRADEEVGRVVVHTATAIHDGSQTVEHLKRKWFDA